jgi:hypothetical protein
MSDLIEAYRNAKEKARHKAGGVTLVCLDDNSLDQSKYGRMGDRTIVPRAREEGGIMGLPLGNDCKYGDGVKRRRVGQTKDGGFTVESEEENFRPDKAYEELDLFSDEMLQEAGVELTDELPEDDPLALLQKRASEVLASPVPQTNGTVNGGDNAMMMQMMGLLAQVVASQGSQKPVVEKKAEPAEPTQPGKSVIFSGSFGRMTVIYANVQIHKEFLVLISQPNQPTMYEPPITKDIPITLETGGREFQVMNFGLSFGHKGDILLLMPLVNITEDSDAEKTE